MKYKINLIGHNNNKKGVINNLNYFFFNYFRYILVLTQLVVISVLFFRFSIDQSIIDLKESINQQEEVLKAVKPIIDETQRVDLKLKESKKIIETQDLFLYQLTYLIPKFPETIFLNTLSLTKDTAQMQGRILNPNHLQSYFNKIKSEKKYAEVTLGQIDRDDDGYTFTMSLKGFKN
ncbi:MAG: hypothetical protein Q8P65_01400 [bacterium]|nr:hypothetical protein [bacterium]